MDTVTHALSGALIARATAKEDPGSGLLGRRVAAGFLAAAAPDLDFVVAFVGPVEYLLAHRGVTHSVLLLPLWALLLAWALAALLRHPGGWRALYGISALALAAHIVGDLITGFGTMVFAPLSHWRAALGTTFIIDPWFTGIIVAGLALGWLRRHSRVPAVLACVGLMAYVGLQYVQKERALQLGARYAQAQGLSDARVQVHPRPLSPFNWTIFVSDDRAHRYAHVNLVRREPRPQRPDDGFLAALAAPYRPADRLRWETRLRYGPVQLEQLARAAWQSPQLDFFRWFADLPALDGVTDGSTCVWFVDLRFMTPGREEMPFRYGVCKDGHGPWRAYERELDGGRQALE